MVRVLVADASEVIRYGLRQMLAGSGVEIVSEAVSSDGVVSQVRDCTPDVVLLGLNGDGLASLGRLKMSVPDVPVLMYSDHNHPNFVAKAVAMGAGGLVLKSTVRDDLLEAIGGAANGQSIWTSRQLRHASSAFSSGPPPSAVNGYSDSGLNHREVEVLKRITGGLSNRDIASELGISYETVRDYVHSLLKKLGLGDRTQAAVWAARQGIA